MSHIRKVTVKKAEEGEAKASPELIVSPKCDLGCVLGNLLGK